MNVETKAVRVLADYRSHPLWLTGADVGDIAPDDPVLGLTPELAGELGRWAEAYDATLDQDDPAESGFPTEEAEAAFVRTGEALARRVAAELGPAWKVTYFDERLRADVEISSA
ncbi:hypothetical protein [Streptomyces sp. NPDC051183]|uniref:hypothetical protein n=1 Tax=unclassified Streptomyces TaxID=2593676 RepID=UPI003442A8BC